MTEIERLVGEFHRRSGVAPATRDFYRWNLERLLVPFCAREGLQRPGQLTADVIDRLGREVEAYRKQDGSPLAPASRRAYMKAVQQFLAWLRDRHATAGLQPREVPVPPRRRVRRTVPTREEIQALEDAAPTERNKLIIRIMGDTGAREGEIAHLRRDALVAKGGRYFYLEVEGKTGARTVPISARLHSRLATYRGRAGHLFPSRAGGALTEKGVYLVVRDAVARAELGRRIYPHLLRHAAITWMLAPREKGGKGLPPSYVVEITGVSQAVISASYDHPSQEQLWDAMATGGWS